MKTKLKKYLKEAVLFFLFLFIVTSGVSLYRTSNMRINNAICENKADIIYFWGAWCPVCKLTSPNIDRFTNNYDIQTIAVQSGRTADIERYLNKNALSFQYINDQNGAIAKKYNITVFPTTVFCKKKKVFLIETGYLSTFGIYLRLMIAKL